MSQPTCWLLSRADRGAVSHATVGFSACGWALDWHALGCGLHIPSCFLVTWNPQWGIADREEKIKVLSVDNPELSKVLTFKPRVGQNIALHAWPAARKFWQTDFCRPSSFNFIFPPNSLCTFPWGCVWLCVGQLIEIGRRHKRWMQQLVAAELKQTPKHAFFCQRMDQVGRLGTLCVCVCMFVYAVYLFIYVLNIFLLLLIYFPHRWVTAWSLMEN